MNKNNLETIVEQINNLSLRENNLNTKMQGSSNQQPKINWDIFKSKLDNIKTYDGNSNTLNKFIFKCENLMIRYNNIEDDEFKQHIFECIHSKLVGKAELMVGNRTELSSWDAVKAALIQCFSDKRDLDCLIQELTRMRPFKGEHLTSFGNRIQLTKSSVIQRVSNDTSLSTEQKICQISHYDKTALNTFIAGCSGQLRNNMYIKKPESLEDAIAFVDEFENFERLYGSMQNTNLNQKPNNQSMQRPNQNFRNFQNNPQNNFQNQPNFNNYNRNPNYQQNYNRQYNPNYQQNPNFQSKPVFPSQPIDLPPSRQVPQRFPTNREVFGPPRNVFKPRPIPPHEQTKPEPMSTTSHVPSTMYSKRNSHIQNFRPNYQQNPNQNFMFQEVYSDENNYDNYNDSDYNQYCSQDYNQYYSDENQYDQNNEYFETENFEENQTNNDSSLPKENFTEPSLQKTTT